MTPSRFVRRTNTFHHPGVRTGEATQMCEQALLAAAKQGQTEAFGTLCQPLAPKLIQTARRITRNREDAEDALQNAFLSAFIHIKNFDGRSRFSTWLTRLAHHLALLSPRKQPRSRGKP